MSSPSKTHTVLRLLQPSFLSAMVTIVSSFAAVAFLLTPSLYSGSDFALYFESLELQKSSLLDDYQQVSSVVNQSEFAADASVFIVWMVIGLLSFAIILSIIKLVASVVRFVRDEEYFKQDRERIARQAFLHLAVRVLAVAGLYGFYHLMMPFAISYIFVFAHAALTGSWLEGIWYVLLMSLVIAACIHTVVVLLRLVLLRLRVFFDKYAV